MGTNLRQKNGAKKMRCLTTDGHGWGEMKCQRPFACASALVATTKIMESCESLVGRIPRQKNAIVLLESELVPEKTGRRAPVE